MPVPRRVRRRALAGACAALGMLVATGCSSSSSSRPGTSADAPAAAGAVPAGGVATTKRRLGPGVNTPYAELLPIADASGDTLYFTRADHPDPTTVDHGKQPNQVYVSHRTPDGTWSDAERLPPPLNDEMRTHTGAVSITSASPDRRTLLVLGDFLSGRQRTDGCADSPDEIGAGEMECLPLAVARNTGTGWVREDRIRTEPYKNRLDVSGGALAPDGRTIVFAARDRNATVGNHNRLFLTRWNEATDMWSSPREIPGLAGAFEALAPFIAPDGRSLYFSSNRTDGHGGFDLYLARRQDDTWLAWSEPQNLGPDVNTAENDASISVDATGRHAFMASGDEAQFDIYELDLPPKLSPAPTAIVGGTIALGGGLELDEGTGGGRFVPSVVFLRLSDGSAVGQASVGFDGGVPVFQTRLPIGEEYSAYVTAPGFDGIGQVIDLKHAQPDAQITQNLSVARSTPR